MAVTWSMNSHLLLHEQRLIRFDLDANASTNTLTASIHAYDPTTAQFRPQRSEKWQTPRRKPTLTRILATKVLADLKNNAVRTPYVILFTSTKTKYAVHILLLDSLAPFNEQLRVQSEFRVDCDLTTNCFRALDGPTLTYNCHHQLNVICLAVNESPRQFPPLFNSSLDLRDFGDELVLSGVCKSSGDLVQIGLRKDSRESNPCVLNKVLEDAECVRVKWEGGQKKVYVCGKSELCEFEGGGLKRSCVLRRTGDERCELQFWKCWSSRREFLVMVRESGDVDAVDLDDFRVI